MPLSSAAPRTPLHHRAIDVRGYRRADGLYDIEAQLIDTGTRPFANGWRQPAAPGDALHDMLLRVTIDDRLVVHAVEAASTAHPYPGECGRATADY